MQTAANAEGLSSAQKFALWDVLKLSLFKTMFGEVVCTRIVNLISQVQFNQSGKLFYQLECKQQELKAKQKHQESEDQVQEVDPQADILE